MFKDGNQQLLSLKLTHKITGKRKGARIFNVCHLIGILYYLIIIGDSICYDYLLGEPYLLHIVKVIICNSYYMLNSSIIWGEYQRTDA